MKEDEVRQIIQEELRRYTETMRPYYELFSDRIVFNKRIQILDGRKIQVGQTTGLELGSSADEKLGLYGTTPVAQQDTVEEPTGGAIIDAEARSKLTQVINRLKLIGIIKSS